MGKRSAPPGLIIDILNKLLGYCQGVAGVPAQGLQRVSTSGALRVSMSKTSIVKPWFLPALLAATLTGCVHLPNTATAQSATDRLATTPVTDATPLTVLANELAIMRLDPRSKISLLEQAMVELGRSDGGGRYRGITYDLTYGNALNRDWLIQTPDIWDLSAATISTFPVECTNCDADFRLPVCGANIDCGKDGAQCGTLKSFEAQANLAGKKLCFGQSDRVIDRWYTLISRAREAVDITLLQPGPDTRFLSALRNAVTMLARSRRAVTVRVLVGQYPPDRVDANALLLSLIHI